MFETSSSPDISLGKRVSRICFNASFSWQFANIFFVMFRAILSGYTLGVNPFNQPGVESYKKNMFALLGKPGYEDQKAELEARLGK